METSYQEIKPSPALQPFVECYWLHHFQANGREESPVQRCLPYGTLELILHLDDNPAYALFDNQWQRLPQALFVGLYRDTVHWKAVGAGRKFGIRIKPEGLIQLFDIPVASLFNAFTDLETFFGNGVNRLVDDVYGLTDVQTVVEVVERFLTARMKHLKAERYYVLEATRMIRQAKGQLSIEGLSARLSISKRQLERSFKDFYGTSPKMYQRIIRFRNAYESLQQNPAVPDWLDISYTFGYADQAHFIRDFKEFSDDSPTLVYKDKEQYFRLPDKGRFSVRR